MSQNISRQSDFINKNVVKRVLALPVQALVLLMLEKTPREGHIKKWKSIIPKPLQCLPLVGRFVYWGLRLGYPWITRVPMALGINFPKLTNHFFVFQSADE